MKNLLTAAAMCLAGSVAMAESYNLHQHKAWSVYLEVPDDAPMYCNAMTENGHGDILQLTAYSSGGFVLFIFMAPDYDGWKGSFEDDLRIDIDYAEWTLNNAYFIGDGPSATVYFTFPAGQQFKKFLTELWQGNAIALKTPSGESSIAAWSLNGSAAALTSLNDCFDRIELSEPSVRM